MGHQFIRGHHTHYTMTHSVIPVGISITGMGGVRKLENLEDNNPSLGSDGEPWSYNTICCTTMCSHKTTLYLKEFLLKHCRLLASFQAASWRRFTHEVFLKLPKHAENMLAAFPKVLTEKYLFLVLTDWNLLVGHIIWFVYRLCEVKISDLPLTEECEGNITDPTFKWGSVKILDSLSL